MTSHYTGRNFAANSKLIDSRPSFSSCEMYAFLTPSISPNFSIVKPAPVLILLIYSPIVMTISIIPVWQCLTVVWHCFTLSLLRRDATDKSCDVATRSLSPPNRAQHGVEHE